VKRSPVPQRFDPAEMALRGRIGAYRLHATHDSREVTAPARAAFLARFEREVDPDGALPAAERLRRAEHARRAHFSKLALVSARTRAKWRARKEAAEGQSAASEEVRRAGADSSL
jgi:hypothetical protein